MSDFVENHPAYRIAPYLRQRGLYLAVAESCTGGLLGHWITNVPGASEYFLGGVIAYADGVKQGVLRVRAETLAQWGAVSRQTVLEMARGVRSLVSAGGVDMERIIGLAISGIAGPGGGTPEKPVGLTWIAMSTAQGDWAWNYHWQGDRRQNKEASAGQALRLLLAYLEGHVPPTG